jgi:hypothetical protein
MGFIYSDPLMESMEESGGRVKGYGPSETEGGGQRAEGGELMIDD